MGDALGDAKVSVIFLIIIIFGHKKGCYVMCCLDTCSMYQTRKRTGCGTFESFTSMGS